MPLNIFSLSGKREFGLIERDLNGADTPNQVQLWPISFLALARADC
jgi:hypothetical protein